LQTFNSDEVALLPDAIDVLELIIRVRINESALEPAVTRLDVRICGKEFSIQLNFYNMTDTCNWFHLLKLSMLLYSCIIKFSLVCDEIQQTDSYAITNDAILFLLCRVFYKRLW